MSVNAIVTEVTKNVKGVSKMGKEYTYTKFVYETDVGEVKTKQVFRDEVLQGVKAGDSVVVSFKKNDKGFFDLASVEQTNAAATGAKQSYARATTSFSDKDVEIEVMNALNVASAGAHLDLPDLLNRVKDILAAKSELVAYAKEARKPAVKEEHDDPFNGIN